MNEYMFVKDLLGDEKTLQLLEHPFENLSEKQEFVLAKHFSNHDVQQFVWLAGQCAEELSKESSFSQNGFLVCNIVFLWDCFRELPLEFKNAFKQLGGAIRKTVKRVKTLLTIVSSLGDNGIA